jgi:hypothetical protein
MNGSTHINEGREKMERAAGDWVPSEVRIDEEKGRTETVHLAREGRRRAK